MGGRAHYLLSLGVRYHYRKLPPSQTKCHGVALGGVTKLD